MPLMISRQRAWSTVTKSESGSCDGDERSVPVWRTAEDYEALAAHSHWMLRGSHISQPRSTLTGQRTHFQNRKNQSE